VSIDSSEDNGALLTGGLIAGRMSANWIVDSGATSHMCYDRDLFVSYWELEKPEKVTISDGRSLRAIGHGTVSLTMMLPGGRLEPRNLLETLHVPKVSFYLVSVSKMHERGRVVHFLEAGCEILILMTRFWLQRSSVEVCFFWTVEPLSRGMLQICQWIYSTSDTVT